MSGEKQFKLWEFQNGDCQLLTVVSLKLVSMKLVSQSKVFLKLVFQYARLWFPWFRFFA